MSDLFYVPTQVVQGKGGLPSGAATVYFYYTGTTIKAPIYSDIGMTTAAENPATADAFGRLSPIYLDSTITYRVRFLDKDDAPVGTDVDPYVPGTITGIFTVKNGSSNVFALDGEGNIVLTDLTSLPAGAVQDSLGTATNIAPSQNAVQRSLPVLSAKGALTPASTALATVLAAMDASGQGGTLIIDAEALLGNDAPENPGVTLIGEKKLYTTPTGLGSGGVTGGRQVFNKIGRDPSLFAWGHEYLGPVFYRKLNAGLPIKIAVIGDSNTEGHAGPYLVALLATLPNVTVVNYGASGTTFEQSVTATGGFAPGQPYEGKDWDSVLATNPDLLIDCYGGTNDPYYGGTIASFEASKRAAYSALRATRSAQSLSIVMVTSGPQNDGTVYAGTTDKRDELWNAQARPIIRQMAQDCEAMFVDKNGRVPDAFVDFLNLGAQNTNLLADGRVHTADWLSRVLAQWVFEDIVLEAFRPGSTNGFMIADKASTDEPTTYPAGLSIARADGTSAWPWDGWVLTIVPTSVFPFALQINWPYSDQAAGDAPIAVRWAINGTPSWRFWNHILPNRGVGSVVAPASGFTIPGNDENMSVYAMSGLAVAQGWITMTTPAALTKGQAIATIPSGLRPSITLQFITLGLFDGTTFERIPAVLNTDGALLTNAASTISPTRIYLEDQWRIA